MAECKFCDKSYHACGSCDLHGYEWYFCCRKCYDNYLEKRKKEISKKFNLTIENLNLIINEIDFIY